MCLIFSLEYKLLCLFFLYGCHRFFESFQTHDFYAKKLTLLHKTKTSFPNIAQSEQIGVQQSLQ